MNIEAHEVGKMLWYAQGNEPTEGEVWFVRILIDRQSTSIVYDFGPPQFATVSADKVFETYEECIESLRRTEKVKS